MTASDGASPAEGEPRCRATPCDASEPRDHRGWICLGAVITSHAVLLGIVFALTDFHGHRRMVGLAVYLGTVTAAVGLLGVWSAFGRGTSFRRALLVVISFAAIMGFQIYTFPREMALISVPMMLMQLLAVQILLWSIRSLANWRCAAPHSADRCSLHSKTRFWWRGFAAWGICYAILAGGGYCLLRMGLAAAGIEQMPTSRPLVVACGANMLVGWLAIRAALVQRDSLGWCAIAIVGAVIVTIVESHLFDYLGEGVKPFHRHLLWCANGIHLGLTALSLWVIRRWGGLKRFCDFRRERMASQMQYANPPTSACASTRRAVRDRQ